MSKENSGRDSPIGQEAGDASNAKVSPADQGIGDSSKVKAAGDSEGSVDKIDSDTGNESEKEGTENGAVKNDDANTADGEGGENAEEDGITDSEIDAELAKIKVPTDADRNQLFEKGLKLDKAGKGNQALKYYLKCLVCLREDSKFALLPQCLRNIGDIYYGKDDYEKAISFVQAEKLYYESVLVDSSEIQKQIDEITASGDASVGDVNIDLLRATEYEQLSRLCMDEKQPQLALEYAGKATKLRQKVYGDGHEEVQKSLDYFATVYAEVGKQQYTESLTKFDPDDIQPGEGDITPGGSENEPVSILRRRKEAEGADRLNKHVSFDESQVPSEDVTEREERIATAVLTILFVICLIILVILGLYIYCTLSISGSTCLNFRHTLQGYVMKLRYWYYHYSSGKDTKYT